MTSRSSQKNADSDLLHYKERNNKKMGVNKLLVMSVSLYFLQAPASTLISVLLLGEHIN